MTRDDIIRMAKEAGLYSGNPRTPGTENMIVNRLQRFAELVAAADVPDGWKLVPEKPTVDMIVDGLNARYIGGGCDEGTMARRMYTALLAAAPEAPAPSVPDWLETTQFLTDVTTAAGLLAYGRRDKGLAQRIGDFAHKYRMLAAAPAARKLA